MKTLFYDTLTETKAKVYLTYYVDIPDELQNLPHISVMSIPEEAPGQSLYINPQTGEMWYE
jgi:hypothetical protein